MSFAAGFGSGDFQPALVRVRRGFGISDVPPHHIGGTTWAIQNVNYAPDWQLTQIDTTLTGDWRTLFAGLAAPVLESRSPSVLQRHWGRK
ncbi:MAG: hypothetical protein R3E39_18560 [Anaerolineae bacterium]